MKVWKIMVVVVFVLLVAALALTVNYILEDKDVKAAKARIENYRIVAEEQRLIRQILEDKIAVARIQASVASKDPNGS
jgi:uncharacterized membrane protein